MDHGYSLLYIVSRWIFVVFEKFGLLVRVILFLESYLDLYESDDDSSLVLHLEDKGGTSTLSAMPCFFHHISLLQSNMKTLKWTLNRA